MCEFANCSKKRAENARDFWENMNKKNVILLKSMYKAKLAPENLKDWNNCKYNERRMKKIRIV